MPLPPPRLALLMWGLAAAFYLFGFFQRVTPAGLRIGKTWSASPDPFRGRLVVRFENAGASPLTGPLWVGVADRLEGTASRYANVARPSSVVDGSLETETKVKDILGTPMVRPGPVSWLGTSSRYFLAALVPEDPTWGTLTALADTEDHAGLYLAAHDSRQNVKMKLRISNVAADAAYTEFVGHELTRDYLRSLVKRRTTRIDSHVPVLTKDGKMVDLSVTCYTLTRANLSQTHAIRGLLFSKTQDLAKEGDFNALLNGIVTGDISKELFKTIKPLFPVRRVEVIKSKVGITRAA